MRRSGVKESTDLVTDGEGTLRRYLFDANVGDSLSKSQVNADILTMLPHWANTPAQERAVR